MFLDTKCEILTDANSIEMHVFRSMQLLPRCTKQLITNMPTNRSKRHTRRIDLHGIHTEMGLVCESLCEHWSQLRQRVGDELCLQRQLLLILIVLNSAPFCIARHPCCVYRDIRGAPKCVCVTGNVQNDHVVYILSVFACRKNARS